MKSNAEAEALSPLRVLAARATERYGNEQLCWEARSAEINAEIDAIKRQMAKAAGKEDMTGLKGQLTSRQRELRDEHPRERRYMTQDATVEKLGELLIENPRGLLVCRDELAGWLCTLDKPGREGDREFYLESWNGTGDYTFDRIGRGTVHVPAVCLSIVGGIQPGKLKRYVSAALSEGWGDDGLLQRLQLLVWPDSLSVWRHANRRADAEAKRKAIAVFEALDKLNPADHGATLPEEGGVPFVRFVSNGQTTYDSFRDALEKRLRSDEIANTPGFEAHLAKYRSLMPKLALVFHLVDGPVHGGVSEDAAQLAVAWCRFLEAHARKVYAAEISSSATAAHRLAEKVEEGAIRDGDTVRAVGSKDWSGLSSVDRVRSGLDILAAAGWVRIERRETGGRPSDVIRLHPDLVRGKEGENAPVWDPQNLQNAF